MGSDGQVHIYTSVPNLLKGTVSSLHLLLPQPCYRYCQSYCCRWSSQLYHCGGGHFGHCFCFRFRVVRSRLMLELVLVRGLLKLLFLVTVTVTVT